jgi:hypothetical protein
MIHDAGVRYQPTIGAINATVMTSPATSSRQRAYLVVPQAASRSPCPGGGGGAGRAGWATPAAGRGPFGHGGHLMSNVVRRLVGLAEQVRGQSRGEAPPTDVRRWDQG